jgi:DNA-binding NarL/FixJ family response regulator
MAHSVEELSTQMAELSGQVQTVLHQAETTQALPHSLRNLDSSAAVCDAVRHVYRRQELTSREIEVCALLIRGYADGEIARRLGTCLGTIKTHAARVCHKLNLDRKRVPWDFFIRLSLGEEDRALNQPLRNLPLCGDASHR